MTIRFYGEAEAEDIFGEELKNWISFGYKGCHSKVESTVEIENLKEWAKESKTAMDIMRFIINSPTEIGFVGMKGGFQCFGSGEGKYGSAVVFIDLDAILSIRPRTSETMHTLPTSFINPMTVKMDNKIAILHEFGHAKQWIENPILFIPTGKGADHRSNPSVFRDAIRAKANNLTSTSPVPTPRSVQSLSEYNAQSVGIERPTWSVYIESDNMARHERPICKELGLPYRDNYGDINGTSHGQISPTSKIYQEAIISIEREKAAEAEKERRRLELDNKRIPCPLCDAKFRSNMLLNRHITASHPLIHP